MAELVGSLTARLIADTKEFNAKLGEAKGEMAGFTEAGSARFNKLASVGKVAFFAIGAAAIGVGAESVKLASTFQSSMAQVQGAAGLTAKQTTDMGNAFLATAGKTEATANEMAAAYGPVAAQLKSVTGVTLTAAQAQSVMLSAADLSDAKMGSLSTTTSALAQTMQAFHINAAGAAGAADILYSSATLTGSGVSQLASAFARMHMSLGLVMPSLKDVGGLVGVLADHGVSGSRGLRTMSSAMTSLLKPAGAITKTTPEITKQMDALKEHMFNANGQFIGMQNAIALLTPSFRTMTQQQQIAASTALFGASAAQTMVKVVLAGPAAYAKDAAAANRAGSAHHAAALQMATLSGQMKVVEGIIDDYGVRLGRVLIPKLETLAKDTSKVVEWFAKEKVIALVLAGIITGVLGVAITAFAVNTIGKLIKNVNSAYNALMKLFGLKGGPQVNQPAGNLNESASTAGTTLGDAIDAAGKQLVADAQAAAAALEAGGVVTGDDIEAGSEEAEANIKAGAVSAEDDIAAGGEDAADTMKAGAVNTEDDVAAGGAAAADEMKAAGATTADDVEAGGLAAADEIKTAGMTTEDDVAAGGASSAEDMRAAALAANEDLSSGGAEASDELKAAALAANEEMAAGGLTAETDVEAGGLGMLSGLRAGIPGIADLIGPLIATQIGAMVANILPGASNGQSALPTWLKKVSQVPVVGAPVQLGAELGGSAADLINHMTGFNPNAQPKPNQGGFDINTKTSDVVLQGITQAEASAIQALVNQGQTVPGSLAAVKAAVAKGASSSDVAKLMAAVAAASAKAAKSSDITKSTAAISKTAKTPDIKAVDTSVKAVKSAISTGKPIQVQSTSNITVELDGKQVAAAVKTELLKTARATGQNVFGNASGTNKTGTGVSR